MKRFDGEELVKEHGGMISIDSFLIINNNLCATIIQNWNIDFIHSMLYFSSLWNYAFLISHWNHGGS